MPRLGRSEIMCRQPHPRPRQNTVKRRADAHRIYREHLRRDRASRSTHPISAGMLKAGRPVWVCVPFDDADQDRTRPAIVLSTTAGTVLCLPLSRTRQSRRLIQLAEEVPQLPYPAAAMTRIVDLDADRIRSVVGDVSEANLIAALLIEATVTALGQEPNEHRRGNQHAVAE